MTFYMYRAQSAEDYALENLNAADLAGVLWYLHNEVVSVTPRKYQIDRIKRYKVTVKNTQEFWNVHHRQFGAFVAYDAGRCTHPKCKDLYHQYGFIVGCQAVDVKAAGYVSPSRTNWNCIEGSKQCRAPLWYSLPGPCPTMGMPSDPLPSVVHLNVNNEQKKTPECIKRMPGGHCKNVTGAPDCTYSYERAGEIFLDNLTGIGNYNKFWNTSDMDCMTSAATGPGKSCTNRREYMEFDESGKLFDKGIGCSFWDGKHDPEKCASRVKAAQALFKKKYPEMPEDLDAPPCEFDMFYEHEFSWDVDHTKAVDSDWWDHRMNP